MTLAFYIGVGLAGAILTFILTALVCAWSERRRQFHGARRETESLTAMIEGDRRTGDVLTFRAKGP